MKQAGAKWDWKKKTTKTKYEINIYKLLENTSGKEQGGSNASLDAYTLRSVGVSTATSCERLKNNVCAQFS